MLTLVANGLSQLPKLINANFPTDPDRTSICGHSMGGHGALVCALRNPGKYKVVMISLLLFDVESAEMYSAVSFLLFVLSSR